MIYLVAIAVGLWIAAPVLRELPYAIRHRERRAIACIIGFTILSVTVVTTLVWAASL